MNRKNYEEKTKELILPVLENLGIGLYDIDYEKEGGEYFLRVYIEKEGGVTINDCVDVSRAFNDILDREDYIRDAYTFEVSSPGLDRPLKKPKDFERNLGNRIEIRTYQKVSGRKEFFGILMDYSDETVSILPDEAAQVHKASDPGAAAQAADLSEYILTFRKKDTSLIRLAYDFDF